MHRDSWAYAYQSYVYPRNPSDFTFLARCDVSQRLHVRMSVPDKAITVVGTAYLSEIGRLTNPI